MDLLEGETLRDKWMATGRRMPAVQVLTITDPILDCLAACHAIGVIHRDLKPANVFLCSDGVVKLLDFGVAQFRSATAERTASGTALGTPAYMSPEQAMGLVDQLDGRADLFSVGAILHALLSGHRINKGRTEQEALVVAATTPVPSVARIAPDLPVEVVALVDKALAWDRRNRFDDARAMQTALRDALRRMEQSAPKGAASSAPPPAPRPSTPSHRPLSAHASRPSTGEMVSVAGGARVAIMRDIFKRIDRVLPSVRQLGWSHPATERALRTAFEAVAESLAADPGALDVSLRPYSLMVDAETVWEPGAPFDAVPYNLFACGIRALRAKPGITQDELRELLALLLLEPGRDLPPEDDLATALWDKALPHVEYDVADAFAEGDASAREAFYAESDELEALAARARASALEARAMAMAMDRGAVRGERTRSPMALDDVVRAVFAGQLALSTERWSERYVDVLTDGLLDAAWNRDAQLVLAALRKSAADLVVAGRVDVVTGLHLAVVDRLGTRLQPPQAEQLSSALTDALFGAETLKLMLGRLRDEPHRLGSFEPVLASLSARELPTVLEALAGELPGPVESALLGYVARVLPGHESSVATGAAHAGGKMACALVALLAKAGTLGAKQALAELARNEDPAVSLEAKIASSSSEALGIELARLCEDPAQRERLAALAAILRHGVKGAWPAISRRVRSPGFHDLAVDERSSLLRALVALSPDHGEPIALEIAKKGGVFVSGEREASRAAAIDALGEHGCSRAALDGLREVAQARWGTSDDVRASASAAAEKVAARMAASAAPKAPS
jgi:hypothetical protein